MNKEQFLQLQLKDISQVYSGKRDCCRCGCGGTYTATSFMKDARSNIDDTLVLKHKNRAKRLVLSGGDVDFGNNYIDIETGEDRTLTFYIDDLK